MAKNNQTPPNSYADFTEKYLQKEGIPSRHTKLTIKNEVREFVLNHAQGDYDRNVKAKIKLFKDNVDIVDWKSTVIDTQYTLKEAIIDIRDLPVSEIIELENLGVDFNIADKDGYINKRANFILSAINNHNMDIAKYLVSHYNIDLNKNVELFDRYVRELDCREVYGQEFFNKHRSALIKLDDYSHSAMIRKMTEDLRSEATPKKDKEEIYALLGVACVAFKDSISSNKDKDVVERFCSTASNGLLHRGVEELFFYMESGIFGDIKELDAAIFRGLKKIYTQYPIVGTNFSKEVQEDWHHFSNLLENTQVPLFLYSLIIHNNAPLLNFLLSHDEYKKQYDRFDMDGDFIKGFGAALDNNSRGKQPDVINIFDYSLLSKNNTSPVAKRLDLLNKKDKNGTPFIKILIDYGLVLKKKGVFNQLYKENVDLFNTKDLLGNTLVDYATKSIIENVHNADTRLEKIMQLEKATIGDSMVKTNKKTTTFKM